MVEMVKGVGLYKAFESGLISKRRVVAVDCVDIEIKRGEILALVGESGSGKSTLGRILLMLIRPDKGRVLFNGLDLTKLSPTMLRKLRRRMQLIPQHPEEALDPRWKLFNSIAEPLRIHKIADDGEIEERVYEFAELVGLSEEILRRYPHEVSGGELQRAVIARAIVLNPEFIVCDEPTSMLDVSVQASIVNLLTDLQRKLSLSYLFITHDLKLAEIVADRIAIMFAGQIVEEGANVLKDPLHPYTQMLVGIVPHDSSSISSSSNPSAGSSTLSTSTSSTNPFPDGKLRRCKFYNLCPERSSVCLNAPESVKVNGRTVRCHIYVKC
jgi:peptide/nickel transport system ATP-binding protein